MNWLIAETPKTVEDQIARETLVTQKVIWQSEPKMTLFSRRKLLDQPDFPSRRAAGFSFSGPITIPDEVNEEHIEFVFKDEEDNEENNQMD